MINIWETAVTSTVVTATVVTIGNDSGKDVGDKDYGGCVKGNTLF